MGFTGIVEEMGIVIDVRQDAELTLWDGTKSPGVVLTIKCDVALGDVYEGASIAVNGTCLTVTSWTLAHTDDPGCTAGTFTVNLSPETLRCTNLREVKPDDRVNLERAAGINARNSGHNVQGHVDCTGVVLSKDPEGDSLWVKIQAPGHVLRYVVPKGYIAVDGTSLTVCEVDHVGGWFNLMLVAHTQSKVVLPHRDCGELVNLEVDVLAKYAEASVGDLRARVAKLEEQLGGASAPEKEAPEGPHDQAEMVAIKKQLGTATKHGAGLKVPLPDATMAGELKVAIVHTCWHEELIGLMVNKCADRLCEQGVSRKHIWT